MQLDSQLAYQGNPSDAVALDVEGDGDMDFFISGATSPGKFPIADPFALFINENGRYIIKSFPEIGLVKSIEAGDIDNDGDLDLILAREWNSIALLLNNNGQFHEAGKSFGLETYKGLWNDAKLADLFLGTTDNDCNVLANPLIYPLHFSHSLYGTKASPIFDKLRIVGLLMDSSKRVINSLSGFVNTNNGLLYSSK